MFPDRTVTTRRQRELVLALPPHDFVPRAKLPTLTPALAEAYSSKKSKTVTRDLNALERLGRNGLPLANVPPSLVVAGATWMSLPRSGLVVPMIGHDDIGYQLGSTSRQSP
jgi:hypothetical protein